MPRRAIVISLAFFAAAPAAAADDPIETCRTQSPTSEARIACLEAAIRAQINSGVDAFMELYGA